MYPSVQNPLIFGRSLMACWATWRISSASPSCPGETRAIIFSWQTSEASDQVNKGQPVFYSKQICRPYRILIPDLKIRILNPIFSKRIGFQILFQKADLDLDFLLSKQNPIRIWKSGFWVVDLRSKSNFFLLWSTFFDNLWRRKAKIFVGYYFFSFLKFSKKKHWFLNLFYIFVCLKVKCL